MPEIICKGIRMTADTGEHAVRRKKPTFTGTWLGYATAIGITIAAWQFRLYFTVPASGPQLPFLFFYPAIATAACIGGTGPGIVAFAGAGFLGSRIPGAEPNWGNWTTLVLVGPLIVGWFARLSRLREKSIVLAEESARLRAAMEQVSDWIFLANEAGRIEYMNRTAREQLWFGGRLVSGSSVEELDASPERGAIRDLVAAARAGSVGLREIELRRGDGSTVIAEVSCSPVRSGEGSAFYLAARDVTERRLIERKLREALQWESLGALTGGLAHDFNNLLTSILGSAMLARQMLPPESPAGPVLDDVERSGERCADLIRLMLAASGYRPRGRAKLRVDEMARGIAAEPRLPANMRIEIEAEECVFESDAGTLDTLLRGLLSNAIESYEGAAGEVTVTVDEAEHLPEWPRSAFEDGLRREGRYLRIAVEDHGCGMTPELLERAFQPFFFHQIYGSRTGIAGGARDCSGARGGAAGGDAARRRYAGRGLAADRELPSKCACAPRMTRLLPRPRFAVPTVLTAFVLLTASACSSHKVVSTLTKRYPVEGDVLAMKPGEQTATVKHLEIKGWMGPMTMDYPVPSRADYAMLHPGDHIKGFVFVQDEEFWLGDIQEAAPPKK